VPYSQQKYHDGYRTDCSGYASMSWQAGTSWATATMHFVGGTIPVTSLKPGDAMLRVPTASRGGHIRIFYGWVDDAHTRSGAYEKTGPSTKSSTKTLRADLADGYKAFRYDRITSGTPSKNALLNGSFDVWAQSWWDTESVVWWSVGGTSPGSVAHHRSDVHRASQSSIELINPSTRSADVAELSQAATVSANATYTATVWAMTNAAPSRLALTVRCLDASGAVLAERTLSGSGSGLDAVAFKPLTFSFSTPPGSARASVAVRLAGGSAVTTGSAFATGTVGVSATLDSFTLVRAPLPLATVTTPHSPSTVRHGSAFTVYGYLKPRHAAGTSAVTLKFYRKQSGAWVLRKTIAATLSDYSDHSKYSVSLSLPLSGTWKVRASHEDADHRASYSDYRSFRAE